MQVNLRTSPNFDNQQDEVAFEMDMPPRKGDYVKWKGVDYVVSCVTWEMRNSESLYLVVVDLDVPETELEP